MSKFFQCEEYILAAQPKIGADDMPIKVIADAFQRAAFKHGHRISIVGTYGEKQIAHVSFKEDLPSDTVAAFMYELSVATRQVVHISPRTDLLGKSLHQYPDAVQTVRKESILSVEC